MKEETKTNGAKLILLVDDDDSIVECLTQLLEIKGYLVITANDGASGLKEYKIHRDKIDLVISDIHLPDFEGGVLYKKIREIDAHQKFVFVSGYIDSQHERLVDDNSRVLRKPYRIQEFIDIIEELTNN